MSLHGLSATNFKVIVDPRSNLKHLTITVQGIVVVFFKKTGCQGCAVLEPVYSQISAEDKRLVFCIIDLQYNASVTSMARDTSTPIQTVPQIFMYVNGRPHAKFRGQRNAQAVKAFINDAIISIPQPQQQPMYNANAFVPSNVGQNMYGGNNYAQGPTYSPEVNVPRQASQLAHGGHVAMSSHPSMQQQCDPDDENCLMVPQNSIPHNLPWESDFRKYMESGKI
jgi:thioredoxin family protein